MERHQHAVSKTALILIAALGFSAERSSAGDFDAWQYQQLMQPTPVQLAAEQRGRVVIYDGMREADVNQAMDGQFDRIDSMMFVRTLRQQADGSVSADGDCG